MKTLVVSDGGARYTLLVRDDADIPQMTMPSLPPQREFLGWWQEYAQQMHIPYNAFAEPRNLAVIRRLLLGHTTEELKELAVHFMLDHGERLRTEPNQIILFASMLSQLKEELRARS